MVSLAAYRKVCTLCMVLSMVCVTVGLTLLVAIEYDAKEINRLKRQLFEQPDYSDLRKSLLVAEMNLDQVKADYSNLAHEQDKLIQTIDVYKSTVELYRKKFAIIRYQESVKQQEDDELRIAKEPIVTDPKECK